MNIYTSRAVVLGRTFAGALLGAIATRPAAALIAAGKIRLSKDPAFNPTPDTTLASLTGAEANYSGYAAGGIAAVFSVVLGVTPIIAGVLANALFYATTASPFVSNNVYGYWVDDGTNICIAEKFAGGGIASFGAAGDFLDLTTIIPADLQQLTS